MMTAASERATVCRTMPYAKRPRRCQTLSTEGEPGLCTYCRRGRRALTMRALREEHEETSAARWGERADCLHGGIERGSTAERLDDHHEPCAQQLCVMEQHPQCGNEARECVLPRAE